MSCREEIEKGYDEIVGNHFTDVEELDIDEIDSIEYLNIILELEEKFQIAIPDELLLFETLINGVLKDFLLETLENICEEEKNESE